MYGVGVWGKTERFRECEGAAFDLKMLVLSRLSHFEENYLEIMTKWIDRGRLGGIGSARRHDGGRPRDRMSIAVLTSVTPPDRFFSRLETSSLTV